MRALAPSGRSADEIARILRHEGFGSGASRTSVGRLLTIRGSNRKKYLTPRATLDRDDREHKPSKPSAIDDELFGAEIALLLKRSTAVENEVDQVEVHSCNALGGSRPETLEVVSVAMSPQQSIERESGHLSLRSDSASPDSKAVA